MFINEHESSDLQTDNGQTAMDLGSFEMHGSCYELQCLTNLEAMVALEGEWRALERSCGLPFVYFQSADWCLQWSRTVSEMDRLDRDVHLRIYVLRRDGELVMVWPMMKIRSRIGIPLLTFLGEPLGQYGNVICDQAQLPVEAGRKCWSMIRRSADGGAITLNQFPKSSFLDLVLGNDGIWEWSREQAAILDLTKFETWDQYHASLSRNRRKQRNRRRRKLEQLGTTAYEVHFGGSDQYRTLVCRALEMKAVWLNETGRHNIALSREGSAEFLLSLNGRADGGNGRPEGALVQALMLDGKPIGIEIGMCHDDHYYSYLGAFDWGLRRFSPGKVQIEYAQKWAKQAGLRKFDFLGDPSEYKSRWTESCHDLRSCSVPVSAMGYLYCRIWKSCLRSIVKKIIFLKLNAGLREKLLRWLGVGGKAGPDCAAGAKSATHLELPAER